MTVVVTASLVVLTTSLHDVSSDLRETGRRARLTHETETDLLLHERSGDALERARLETRLHQMVAEDFGFSAASMEAGAARERAKTDIVRYLGSAPSDGGGDLALQKALVALDPVEKANTADADALLARAGRLDHLSDVIAGLVAAVMVTVLAFVVVWARRSVARPMLALAGAMDRFARGELSARTPTIGATELRRMGQRFNAMADALARQRQARLTHIAGVVHDLRNPLAALQLSAALVDPEQPLPPETSVRRAFALVRRQVARLNRMTEDLLDAAHISAGRLALKPSRVDLRGVVRDVAVLFEGVSENHDVCIDVPAQPCVVMCDPLRVEQTLSNLVSNAIKYSPRGGSVRIRLLRDGDVASVSVSDEGVGIAEADLDDIWEPFRRTGVSAETIPGVGLGLWTSQRIVEAHGGSIDVQSTIGRGSTFTVSLPIDMQPLGARREPATILAPPEPVGAHG
jgi:signal transduction histidine kinase